MPKQMKSEKTTPRKVMKETDLRYAKADRDALLIDVTERLKFNTNRLYEIAQLFVSKPRSHMTKGAMQKMLEEIWLTIPDTVQLVARDGLPESALYGFLKTEMGKVETKEEKPCESD